MQETRATYPLTFQGKPLNSPVLSAEEHAERWKQVSDSVNKKYEAAFRKLAE